ncbi:hypothetical protein M0804_009386 [Polistes exclamans]|nr:hypothetical protein M0804_009386 [Polistes exclamans]
MLKNYSSDTEDSGIGRSSSESTMTSSGTSTDSSNQENGDIKSINVENKEFQIKKCDKNSSKKGIVTIENNLYELLSEKNFMMKGEKSPTMNKNEKSENVDNEKCNKKQKSNVESDTNELKKMLDNISYNQESNEKENTIDMVFDYLKASQIEWNRLVHESVNIRLLSIFDKATSEEIAKELKENMTDEVILLINNANNEISLNDIINHLPKMVSKLIEKIMYKYLQIKINDKINLLMKNDQSAEKENLSKLQMLDVENENVKNLNNSNEKFDQSQLETPVIINSENKGKESTEQIQLENEIRKSYIAKMEIKNMGSSLKRSYFADELFAYMRLRGTPILEVPMYGITRLDFYLLYRQVIARGGYTEVSENNLWKNILSNLGTPCRSIYAPSQLKQLYERYLYPYECEKKSPSILQTIIETTIRRPNFQDIVSQSYDEDTNKKSKSSNIRNDLQVSVNELSKTIFDQYKRPFSFYFKENEKKLWQDAELKEELTKDLSSLELKFQTDKSKFKLSCCSVIPEICSLIDSKIKTDIDSDKASTDDRSSETSSDVKSVSDSEYEIIEVISEKNQKNELTIRNSKLFTINTVIFALISFFLLIILHSETIFCGSIDIF